MMKLKELVVQMENAIDKLALSHTNTNKSGITYISLGNLINIREGVDLLESAGLFKDLIDEIKSSDIYAVAKDTILVDGSTSSVITEKIKKLVTLSQELRNTLYNVVGVPKENTIYIRLADVVDFKDLSKNADSFQKILSQTIIHNDIQGNIKIESVENGSIWLEVALGSSTAVTLVGALAWSAAVIFKKAQEGRLLAEVVRNKKIQNDSKADLQAANKVLLDYMIEAEANHLYEEYYEPNDPEQVERLKYTIKLLAEEMSKGAEVHPSISAPEQVSNLFPKMNNLFGLESNIKKISNEQ